MAAGRRRCPRLSCLRRWRRQRRRTTASDSADAEFNAAIDKVVNPSDKKGGTLKFANSGDWDTLDPGETYYGYSWNFSGSTAARC